jgi:predicted nuclease of predicted toxin-antitoxin system
MRLLADENFPGAAVLIIRELGHDILWVRELTPGVPDTVVMEQARAERRVLVTFDKDFGELARSTRLPRECGVVLFRVPMPRAVDLRSHLVNVLLSRDDWIGHFSVIEPGRIRMRPLH